MSCDVLQVDRIVQVITIKERMKQKDIKRVLHIKLQGHILIIRRDDD